MNFCCYFYKFAYSVKIFIFRIIPGYSQNWYPGIFKIQAPSISRHGELLTLFSDLIALYPIKNIHICDKTIKKILILFATSLLNLIILLEWFTLTPLLESINTTQRYQKSGNKSTKDTKKMYLNALIAENLDGSKVSLLYLYFISERLMSNCVG